jgi:5-methylcytosine-specific restriction endonuclease McrA
VSRPTQDDPNAHALYMREWRAKNLERNREINRECYYRHREARLARMHEDRWRDPERRRAEAVARHNERFATEPEYRRRHRASVRLSRANKRFGKSALAAVHREEIKAFYFACPPGMEVDHIHPLRIMEGKEHVACGLHVPWNLQYLTSVENKKKGRKLETVKPLACNSSLVAEMV